MCAAMFVTVVWVLPHIASDFGVSILCFSVLFGHMCTPGVQMTYALSEISASLSELYLCTVV